MSKRTMKIVIGVLAVALVVVGGLAMLKNLNSGNLAPGSQDARDAALASGDAEPDMVDEGGTMLSIATPSDTEE